MRCLTSRKSIIYILPSDQFWPSFNNIHNRPSIWAPTWSSVHWLINFSVFTKLYKIKTLIFLFPETKGKAIIALLKLTAQDQVLLQNCSKNKFFSLEFWAQCPVLRKHKLQKTQGNVITALTHHTACATVVVGNHQLKGTNLCTCWAPISAI